MRIHSTRFLPIAKSPNHDEIRKILGVTTDYLLSKAMYQNKLKTYHLKKCKTRKNVSNSKPGTSHNQIRSLLHTTTE